MTISTIALRGANGTIDFGRQVLNGIVSNLNQMLATSYYTTGTINVATPNGQYVSLNVASGLIYGNGSGLISIRISEILGTIKNSQLQNSAISILTGNGMSGGASVSLGSQVNLTVAVVDSITNTRTNLPASANSAAWAKSIVAVQAVNASFVTLGTLATNVGGTGQTTYSGNGSMLIGNNGTLSRNTIALGAGISAVYGQGSLRLSANLIQGSNLNLALTGANSGIYISANAPPTGDISGTMGIIKLFDSNTSSNVDLAATPNSVNALYRQLSSALIVPFAPNRLVAVSIYNSRGTYTWNVAPTTAYLHVTVVASGGPGGGDSALLGGTVENMFATGGCAGQHIEAFLTLSQLQTKTVTAGGSNGNTQIIRVGGPMIANQSLSPLDDIYQANGRSIFGQYNGAGKGNIILSVPGHPGSTRTTEATDANVQFLIPSFGLGETGSDTSFSGGDQGWIWYYTAQVEPGEISSCWSQGDPASLITKMRMGKGASGLYGRGGEGGLIPTDQRLNGNHATGYGAGGGGGGAFSENGSANVLGGTSSGGIVIVREYSGS